MVTTKTGRTTPSTDKGTLGNPTSASSWKQGTVKGTLITVPSGNTCLVRAPGMQAFLKEGVIPNGLMSIVQESMIRGASPTEDATAALLEDPDKLKQIMQLADAICVTCCMDPKVSPAPQGADGMDLAFDSPDRDPDILYVDEVDFNDKMFIFNFAVGGTADLEKFRTES